MCWAEVENHLWLWLIFNPLRQGFKWGGHETDNGSGFERWVASMNFGCHTKMWQLKVWEWKCSVLCIPFFIFFHGFCEEFVGGFVAGVIHHEFTNGTKSIVEALLCLSHEPFTVVLGIREVFIMHWQL